MLWTNKRKMATRLGLMLSALLLFFSCSNRSWELIPEEDVRRLLPRYALLSAGLQNRGEADSVRQAAYRRFFEEGGYTLQDWDSSMVWYAKNNIPLYHDFYRLASDSLSKLTEALQKRSDSIVRVEERQRKLMGAVLDSVNLLKLGMEVFGENELINMTFSLQPTTPYTGLEGTLTTRIAGLPKLAKRDALSLELRFHSKDSTSQIQHLAIQSSGVYHVRLVTMEGKDVVRISGYLRGIVPKKLPKDGYVFVDSLRFVRLPHSNIPNPKKSKTDSLPPKDELQEDVVELL